MCKILKELMNFLNEMEKGSSLKHNGTKEGKRLDWRNHVELAVKALQVMLGF